jgi:hypothetical protein
MLASCVETFFNSALAEPACRFAFRWQRYSGLSLNFPEIMSSGVPMPANYAAAAIPSALPDLFSRFPNG